MSDAVTSKRSWTVPSIMAVAGIALIASGAVRLPAELDDLPGNVAAEALWGGRLVPPNDIARIVDTRTRSVKRHPTAERWFTVGHAKLVSGNPQEAHIAYAQGLLLAPARGVAWAAYAQALKAAGNATDAAKARAHSIHLAPHDPRAVRLRRN